MRTSVVVVACLCLSACATSSTSDDPLADGGSEADGALLDAAGGDSSCALSCIPIPAVCTFVDDGTCCGTYVCPDAGVPHDAGCSGWGPQDCGVVIPAACHFDDPCGCTGLSGPGTPPDCAPVPPHCSRATTCKCDVSCSGGG
jgi:hypothetical protein